MVATSVAELRANAKAVRARLISPTNAVVDRGIDLRARRQPPPPPPPIARIIWIPHKVRISDVLQLVADYYRIPIADLMAHRRTVTLGRLRHICGWLAHEVLGRSYPEIARAMNRRDHKMLLFGTRKIYEGMQVNSDLAFDVAELEKRMAAVAQLLIAGRPEPRLSRAMTRSMAIARIVKLTSDYYKMPVDCVLGTSRLVSVTKARHVACYLARSVLGRTFGQIGLAIERDHSTLVVAFKKIKRQLPEDAELSYDINMLKQQILCDKGGA